jgi:hypothetical protein
LELACQYWLVSNVERDGWAHLCVFGSNFQKAGAAPTAPGIARRTKT